MNEALNSQDIDSHDRFRREDMIRHGTPGFGSIRGLDGFKPRSGWRRVRPTNPFLLNASHHGTGIAVQRFMGSRRRISYL